MPTAHKRAKLLSTDPIKRNASYFQKCKGSNKRTVPKKGTVSCNWNQRVTLWPMTSFCCVNDDALSISLKITLEQAFFGSVFSKPRFDFAETLSIRLEFFPRVVKFFEKQLTSP